MKVPDGISVNAGDTIPLWHYDPDSGLWIEEGAGNCGRPGCRRFLDLRWGQPLHVVEL